MHGGKDYVIHGLTLLVYLNELALGVFAYLSLYRDIVTESWWMIGLNVWQLVVTILVACTLSSEYLACARDARRLFYTSMAAAAALIIAHSVLQGVIESDDAETVSPTSESDLYATFIALAGARIVIFILNTVNTLNVMCYSRRGNKQQ